jgi:hypothetical protein
VIRERSKGVWEVSVYVGRVGGRRVQKTETVHGGKRKAEGAERRLRAEVGDGRHRHQGATVGQLLQRWYDHAAPRWSPTTAKTVRGYLDREIVPALGRLRLEELTAARLDDFYDTLLAKDLAPADRAPVPRDRAQGVQRRRAVEVAGEEPRRRRRPARTETDTDHPADAPSRSPR